MFLKNLAHAIASNNLGFFVLIIGILLLNKEEFFEQTTAFAPFFIAWFINFSPFNLFPLSAKNKFPFLTFRLSNSNPLISILLILLGQFLIIFFKNLIVVKVFVIYG